MQMRIIRGAAILVLALLLLAGSPRPPKPLSYSGLTVKTGYDELRARYPHSRFETGDFGTVVVRVAQQDVRDGIWYIQLERDRENRTTRLTIRFNPPSALRGSVRQRTCVEIMRSITSRYGPPMKEERPWYEERARHEPKLWFDDEAQLTFDCGEYAVMLEPRRAER